MEDDKSNYSIGRKKKTTALSAKYEHLEPHIRKGKGFGFFKEENKIYIPEINPNEESANDLGTQFGNFVVKKVDKNIDKMGELENIEDAKVMLKEENSLILDESSGGSQETASIQFGEVIDQSPENQKPLGSDKTEYDPQLQEPSEDQVKPPVTLENAPNNVGDKVKTSDEEIVVPQDTTKISEESGTVFTPLVGILAIAGIISLIYIIKD